MDVNSKILFLDFDGVLNSQKNLYNSKKPKKTTESMISKRNLFWVGLFCRISKCKVVISSSWRNLWDENMKPCSDAIKTTKLLQQYGIEIIGKTTSEPAHTKLTFTADKFPLLRIENQAWWRGTQILQYIDDHHLRMKNIIIFDDDIDDIDSYPELSVRTVHPSFYKSGFGLKHFLKALSIISKN